MIISSCFDELVLTYDTACFCTIVLDLLGKWIKLDVLEQLLFIIVFLHLPLRSKVFAFVQLMLAFECNCFRSNGDSLFTRAIATWSNYAVREREHCRKGTAPSSIETIVILCVTCPCFDLSLGAVGFDSSTGQCSDLNRWNIGDFYLTVPACVLKLYLLPTLHTPCANCFH